MIISIKRVRGGGNDELISVPEECPGGEARHRWILVGQKPGGLKLQQHVARGAEFFQKKQYPAAETEYRSAIWPWIPRTLDLHVAFLCVERPIEGWTKH